MAFAGDSASVIERVRYITPEEFSKRLLPAAKKDPNAWMIFYVIGNLGLRVLEAHRLTAEDVSKTDSIVAVHTAKQRKSVIHEVRVPEQVIEKLREWIKSHKIPKAARLFPWSVRHSQALWDKYAMMAGLKSEGKNGRKGRGIHSLRHMRGLWLADSGVHPVVIQKMLRQNSFTSTQVYLHTIQLKDIANKLGALG